MQTLLGLCGGGSRICFELDVVRKWGNSMIGSTRKSILSRERAEQSEVKAIIVKKH